MAPLLRYPAPCGRGSESRLMGKQARGFRSIFVSIGDLCLQWWGDGRVSCS